MSAQEWINLQEGLYMILSPVFISAITLVAVASIVAGLIGSLMALFSQVRKS